MKPKGSFLSLRINPARLALAATWGAVGLLAALTLLYVEADVRWAAPVVPALAVYGWLRWRARRRPMPDLAPDQAVFRVSLPSAWPLATDYLLIVLFCLGGCVLGAVIAVLFGGIAGKDSFSGWGLVSAGFLAFGAGFVLLFGALAVYYLVRMSRLAMFSLTAHGDGALTAGLPHRSVHLVLAGLRARRILAPAGGSGLYALVIVPKHGPEVWIPTFPENPHQRRFLEQLCAWLEARGVPVSTQRRLISSSQLLFLWEITVWAALAIVCVFGAPAIVAPVSFWVQWLLWGTASFLIVLGFYFAALALGIVFWLGSMGKWMRELFTGALFRMPLRSDERFPTLIMEESLSAETFGMDSRRGSLRVEGNALVVETRKDRWRIEPSRVVGVQRAGLDATVVMMSQERFLLRPIKILWEGEDGCLRGLYVASRGGWTVRRNLRLDRQLFQMLETWRRDGGVPALAQLSLGPRRLGAALAAVFLILTIFLIPIHNKLVGDYLRTGKLLMPSWVKPGARLGPVSVLSAQAIEPGPVLCADRFRDMLCIPRCWTKDFATGQIRPFASLSFPIPGFPGNSCFCLPESAAKPRIGRPDSIHSKLAGDGTSVRFRRKDVGTLPRRSTRTRESSIRTVRTIRGSRPLRWDGLMRGRMNAIRLGSWRGRKPRMLLFLPVRACFHWPSSPVAIGSCAGGIWWISRAGSAGWFRGPRESNPGGFRFTGRMFSPPGTACACGSGRPRGSRPAPWKARRHTSGLYRAPFKRPARPPLSAR